VEHPFFLVNLDEVNTDISVPQRMGLDKSEIRVGDTVGFPDRQNNDVHGEVIRLNQKTATIKTNANVEWRVGYQWLHLVLDGQQRTPLLIKKQIIDAE
jgi:hypothetical protein